MTSLPPHLHLSMTLSPMSLNSTPPFLALFPVKVNYHSTGLRLGLGLGLGFPRSKPFSAPPFRAGWVRAGKSLVEDEEGLSEWVNELKAGTEKGRGDNSRNVATSRSSNGNSRDNSGRNSREKPYNSRGGLSGISRESSRFGNREGRGGSSYSSSRENSRFEGRESRGGNSYNSSRGSSRFGSREGGPSRENSRFGSREGDSLRRSSRFWSEGSSPRENSRFGSREGDSSRGDLRFGSREDSSSRESSRFGSREGDSSRGSSRFGSKEGQFERRDTRGGLRGGSSSRNTSGSSRFGGGVERRNGGSVRGRGGGGGRMSSRGGRGGRGRDAFVLEEEVVDEEEFGDYDTRKGREVKEVSGFMDLIGEGDSEEDDVSEFETETETESEGEEVEGRSRTSFFANEGVNLNSASSSEGTVGSYLSETRFDQCAVSHLSLKAIKDVGYEKMTMVQEATLPVILQGKDVMAKARTGTGKTIAFLLPSIEAVIKTPPAGRDQRWPPILVLVVCPTRELACQAASEANNLVKYHPTVGVQVVIGGTRPAVEQKRMQANPCQILVATPGRLKDHLENTTGFASRLMGVKILVLDEADHLLDMGFRRDIEKIVASVPKQRQTLLFSATIPDEVRQICHIALKRDYEYINTVQEGSGETHSQVRQMHLIAPLENQFPLLYSILKDHISDDPSYKVLVFCTTAMVTRLVADILGQLKLNVREIHSRKPQGYRTRVSDEFRKSKGIILVTSDVSARGVDYPDVTLVIQVGLPSDREQYIHRLGRTGRKGKEGQGILLLAPWEDSFLNTIKDIPISKATPPMVDPDVRKKVERVLSNVEMKNKEAAYQAWLGYYNSTKTVGRDKTILVQLANEFSRSMGLDQPPAISKMVLGKMGLRNVPGLRSK